MNRASAPSARVVGASVHRRAHVPRRPACSWNRNSPILIEGTAAGSRACKRPVSALAPAQIDLFSPTSWPGGTQVIDPGSSSASASACRAGAAASTLAAAATPAAPPPDYGPTITNEQARAVAAPPSPRPEEQLGHGVRHRGLGRRADLFREDGRHPAWPRSRARRARRAPRHVPAPTKTFADQYAAGNTAFTTFPTGRWPRRRRSDRGQRQDHRRDRGQRRHRAAGRRSRGRGAGAADRAARARECGAVRRFEGASDRLRVRV